MMKIDFVQNDHVVPDYAIKNVDDAHEEVMICPSMEKPFRLVVHGVFPADTMCEFYVNFKEHRSCKSKYESSYM